MSPRSIRAAAGAALACIALWAAPAHAQPRVLDLQVTPKAGTTGDQFIATVTIEVESGVGPDQVWAPAADDFTVADTQVTDARSRQYDPVSGADLQLTVEKRAYTLIPKRTGDLTIGPARVRLDGHEYATAQVTVQVADPNSSPRSVDPDPTLPGGIGAPGFRRPQLPPGHPDVFLHVVADETNPYVGQQVIVTWLLYTRDELQSFEPTPPTLDDLWSEKLYEPDHLSYFADYVDGALYRVAIVSKRALFPTRSGSIEVGPFRAKVQSYYARAGAPTQIESRPVTLDVKALPPGAPPRFDPSYVGRYSVSASIDRGEIDAGESLTLTLRVNGEGAIRRTTPPDLRSGGFAFRTPRDFDEKVNTSGNLVRGERTYRYWTTPQQGGKQTIPPLEIPYFDPGTGQYEVARTEPISLVVHGDPSAIGVAGGGSAVEENFIAPDIRLIHDGTTISSVTLARSYQAPWFWALAAFPLAGFIGLLGWQRLRRGAGRGAASGRLRRARDSARKRFKVADIHLRGNRPADFFAELTRAIYEHVEERVEQPTGSLTREGLAALMREKAVPDELIGRIDEELANCDFARFTPAASGPAEMREAFDRTRALLRDIERSSAGGEEVS